MMTSAIKPIRKILIANRGEIACRIIRTARRMGIATVAVFAEADRAAQHVAEADEAYPLGGTTARESYLAMDKILAAAGACGADAIHPGYGFLSENADFAAACAAAGIVFIGPSAETIRAMGSKSAAKRLMQAAEVPLVPGYHDEDQAPSTLARAAKRIGYPVLIKATAGGGGKGMKIVEAPDLFADALASAQREARNAFGDDRVLIERYLTQPRHIEMQVFADAHGNILHLFERDCSVQRRYQKVVEEAPAPGMTAERRARMGEAAIAAARSVNYQGAGTVEFIVEGDDFYFMEMNTRLQVEHPVTEAITGLDLVEWQIRVARGEALPLRQDQVTARGHAIEVRLYAEDPVRDFLPQTGRLEHLRLPVNLPGIRVDSGFGTGDTVSIHYDPMLAKIIAHGSDRAEAAMRLQAALAGTEVVGVGNNRAFLHRLIGHPAFAAAELDTGFIERHRAELLPPPIFGDRCFLALAALALLDRGASHAAQANDPADPYSPWGSAGFWSNTPDCLRDEAASAGPADEAGGGFLLHLVDRDERLSLRGWRNQDGRSRGGGFVLRLPDGGLVSFAGKLGVGGEIEAEIDGRALKARAIFSDGHLSLFCRGDEHIFGLWDPSDGIAGAEHQADRILSPMPGSVIAVQVGVGDHVRAGMSLMIVEAMKMEHTIRAPRDGIVAALPFAKGDLVSEGVELVVLEAPQ
ncbi:MAG TPA: biotin carboxylase N-terminal domain-containing protein [Terriglobia bacterium]|nr:biotin carboxylase N-terminal domain-containing protein [Terriglobia bacterium]